MREEHVLLQSVPVVAMLEREGDGWRLELRIDRNVLISRHDTREDALRYANAYVDAFVMP